MITNISYRRATIDDLNALVGLELACFSTPWSEASLREDLQDPHHKFYYVAQTTSGAIVAYMGLARVLDEGQVSNIAVFPTWQGQGIGEGLLRYVIEDLRDSNVSVIYLEVRQSNEKAIKLYTKMGFIIDGARKDFYSHPKEDAYLLSYRF